jgi:hypothetical protein
LTSAFLVVVVRELLKAAEFVTFVRSIEALGFSVTEITFWDALSAKLVVIAGKLRFWVAAALSAVVEREILEATSTFTFITSITALGKIVYTITKSLDIDAFTVGMSLWTDGTLVLGFLAATFLIVVDLVFLEAAVVVTLIGSIRALGFSIASAGSVDAITVLALPLGRLAAAFLVVVELDALEAAKFVDLLIRFIGAMGFTITEVILLDAVTVSTGPFTLWIATALLAVVEAVSSEATE